MKVNNKETAGMNKWHGAWSRLMVIAVIVLAAAGCATTYEPVKPTSTGKTIKTSSPPDDQLVIEMNDGTQRTFYFDITEFYGKF